MPVCSDGGALKFAAPGNSLEPPFGVSVLLRSVAVCHELAGWLLEWGFCPIAIRFNID
jgi:hypothetical protein